MYLFSELLSNTEIDWRTFKFTEAVKSAIIRTKAIIRTEAISRRNGASRDKRKNLRRQERGENVSEPVAKRQMFEYDGDNPFHIYNLPYYPSVGDELLFNQGKQFPLY